ncbi:MAG: hypothetical protein MRY78_19185 [Saprospiraceae bacterium]|nr:hypothetical protein [Saprospiraceae bacterium]
MKHFFLDRQLNKLENEANDDLLLLLDVSPEYYSTKELKALLRELKTKEKQVKKTKEKLFLVGASGSIWMALSFLAQMIDVRWFGLTCLALIPVAFGVYIGGSIIVEKRNRFFKDAYLIEKIIRGELERRQKDASIF